MFCPAPGALLLCFLSQWPYSSLTVGARPEPYVCRVSVGSSAGPHSTWLVHCREGCFSHWPVFLWCCSAYCWAVSPWDWEAAGPGSLWSPKATHLSRLSLSCQAVGRALVMVPHRSHAVDQGSSLGILEQIQDDQIRLFPEHSSQAIS